MSDKQQSTPVSRDEEHPPFNVRVTQSGKFEMVHVWPPDAQVKHPPRGFVEAVVGIDKDAKGLRDAVVYVRRRRGNMRAVLTVAQMMHDKVARLVTKGGLVLAE